MIRVRIYVSLVLVAKEEIYLGLLSLKQIFNINDITKVMQIQVQLSLIEIFCQICKKECGKEWQSPSKSCVPAFWILHHFKKKYILMSPFISWILRHVYVSFHVWFEVQIQNEYGNYVMSKVKENSSELIWIKLHFTSVLFIVYIHHFKILWLDLKY